MSDPECLRMSDPECWRMSDPECLRMSDPECLRMSDPECLRMSDPECLRMLDPECLRMLQSMYRDVTMGSGLMEPEGEGRPLLSLQDLESRLVFTRCKPFVLSSPGRQWIFGGDLSRVEGRAVRPFWALLFSDLILFTKVSRDRVLFITEEPLSLLSVTQAFFNIRKKDNEFRLQVDGASEGTDSPAQGGCGPELQLTRSNKKNTRKRAVTLRAPTAELKAVWQNLIQRQIIYLNTTRGGTPASSPLESPDPPTTLSVATLDSLSLRRQAPVPDYKSLDELIEHKCRQLGKSGAHKGSALHLEQWMKGKLGAGGPLTPEDEPVPEVWSLETLRRRSEQLQLGVIGRSDSRCEEVDVSDTERSQSRSTERSRSDSQVRQKQVWLRLSKGSTVTSRCCPQVTVRSAITSRCCPQVTVRSGGLEQPVAVCRQCHKTCLASSPGDLEDDDDDLDGNWGPLILMGMSALNATVGLGAGATAGIAPADPFSPSELPLISVLPPTPDTLPRNSSLQWEDSDLSLIVVSSPSGSSPSPDTTQVQETPEEDDSGEEGAQEEPPYRALSSPPGLKRYGTLASLEMLESDDEDDVEGEWRSEEEEDQSGMERGRKGVLGHQNTRGREGGGNQQMEAMTLSLRGWTARAGSYVAEKMALFEDSRAAAFLDSQPDCPRNVIPASIIGVDWLSEGGTGSALSLAEEYES
uniref:PH domain-containing protein n=1 Tax=Timema monikensis TaxID=170555 RepID=A0A7R9HTN4_9NEOP|nr:unnamed protein product [Timema monikensis]